MNGITNMNGTASTKDSDDAYRPLRILIAGAGIGGLAAAIALRRQGHTVTLFESSSFANETGAAINVAPNASSVLLKLGVDVEESGAVVLDSMRLLKANGELLNDRDMRLDSHRWQTKWLMTHRAHLHEHLKATALSSEGVGKPVELLCSHKVSSVDPDTATLSFASGTTAQGDLIVGADGVHSATRSAIAPHIRATPGAHSAFRFLVKRQDALDDPRTAEFFTRTNCMELCYAEDRKVVVYPCANNQLLNFVCIHPAVLSGVVDGYNTSASKDKMLEIFAAFTPVIFAMLEKADPDKLKVYPLFDMDPMPTYIRGRLALIGDAAHPFLPHLAQGGAMAIEDGVSLGVMLSSNSSAADVPSRLQLYDEARHDRANLVQKYTRIVGGDSIKDDESTTEKLSLNEYLEFALSHDEHDASWDRLRRRQWSQNPESYWRQPVGFGPMPGPRQDYTGSSWRQSLDQATSRTTTITFKSSATFLRQLLPTPAYSFNARDTVVHASFQLQELDNLPWLGGSGYNLLGFYIHNVQYTSNKGDKVTGSYLPVMFEDFSDPITTGREELGFPKVYSDINIKSAGDSYLATMSWRGNKWASFECSGLRQNSEPVADEFSDHATLVHKFIPGVGQQSKVQADADYAVMLPSEQFEPQYRTLRAQSCKGSDVSIKFDALDWKRLPTLHHIVSRLAETPVFEIVQASVIEAQGVSDLRHARKVD